MADDLGTPDIARLLGVSRPRVWQLRKRPDFPAPTRTGPRGQEYWDEAVILRWLASSERELAAKAPRLYRPGPPEAIARFLGARMVDHWVVLTWDTAVGSIAMAHPTDDRPANAEIVLDRLSWLDTVVAVRFPHLVGPELVAHDHEHPGRAYTVQWTDLARVFGTPAPWWPETLRRPDEMLQWQPGVAELPAVAVADPHVAPLREMAATYPADSSVAITLTSLADRLQWMATEDARRAVEIARSDLQRVPMTIAAVPLDIVEPADPPAEMVQRDAWSQLLQRTDGLATTCVTIAVQYDSGEHFPSGATVQLRPQDRPIVQEWQSRLQPSHRTAAAARLVLDEDVDYLADPATDLPVVRQRSDGTLRASAPQYLPTTSPLAEVIFDHNTVWIRTADGTLYLAPQRSGEGISYGYSGSGPRTLAKLLALLLDDITASAPGRNWAKLPMPPGLLDLTQTDWPDGTIVPRDVLEAARSGER